MKKISIDDYLGALDGVSEKVFLSAYEKHKFGVIQDVATTFKIDDLELFEFNGDLIIVNHYKAIIIAEKHYINGCYELKSIATKPELPPELEDKIANDTASAFVTEAAKEGVNLIALVSANRILPEHCKNVYQKYFYIKEMVNTKNSIFNDGCKIIKLYMSKYTDELTANRIADTFKGFMETWDSIHEDPDIINDIEAVSSCKDASELSNISRERITQKAEEELKKRGLFKDEIDLQAKTVNLNNNI